MKKVLLILMLVFGICVMQAQKMERIQLYLYSYSGSDHKEDDGRLHKSPPRNLFYVDFNGTTLSLEKNPVVGVLIVLKDKDGNILLKQYVESVNEIVPVPSDAMVIEMTDMKNVWKGYIR